MTVMLIGESEYSGSIDEYGCYRANGRYYPPIKEYYVCKGRKVLKRLFPIGIGKGCVFLTESSVSTKLSKSVSSMGLYSFIGKKLKRIRKVEPDSYIICEK